MTISKRIRVIIVACLALLAWLLVSVRFEASTPERSNVFSISHALADPNVWLNVVNHNTGGSSSASSNNLIGCAYDGQIDFALAAGSCVYTKFNGSAPHIARINHIDNNGQFSIGTIEITLGIDPPGGVQVCSYYDTVDIDYAPTKAQSDANIWTNYTSYTPSHCATDTFNPSPTLYAYSFRITFTGYHQSGGGELGTLQEIAGYGAIAPTITPTPTSTQTPTFTRTPTITLTPTRTQTAINVAGNCGGPGQVPCNVYWLTPQVVGITGTVVITGHVIIDNTPIPTSTPFGEGRIATAVAVVTSGPVGVSYSVGSTTSWTASGFDFIVLVDNDYGCPLYIPIFDISNCFTYDEIQAVNMGPIAIPVAPFGLVLIAGILFRFLKNR